MEVEPEEDEVAGAEGEVSVAVSSSANLDQSTASGSKGHMPHFRNPFLIVDITMAFSNASRKIFVKLLHLTVRIRLDAKDISFA